MNFQSIRMGTRERKIRMLDLLYDKSGDDLILAYLPRELNERRPSYGTVIEIGWAIGLRKPIIVVTDDDYLSEHPLIKAKSNWIFDNFNDENN